MPTGCGCLRRFTLLKTGPRYVIHASCYNNALLQKLLSAILYTFSLSGHAGQCVSLVLGLCFND